MRCRYSSESAPDTRTKARGRRTTAGDVMLDITTSLGSHDVVPVPGRAEAGRARTRPRPAPTRPVPDREVAGPARRNSPEDEPRHLGLQGLRRGGGADHAYLRGAPGAAANRDHDRHPLRDTLEPVRHGLQGRALARAGEARPPETECTLRARARAARLHRKL